MGEESPKAIWCPWSLLTNLHRLRRGYQMVVPIRLNAVLESQLVQTLQSIPASLPVVSSTFNNPDRSYINGFGFQLNPPFSAEN